MPTKRTILAELTRRELWVSLDLYGLQVPDRHVKAQLVDALARSRKARVEEVLQALSRDRLKALCRAFGLDDSGRKKADLVARLAGPAPASSTAASRSNGRATSPAQFRPGGEDTGSIGRYGERHGTNHTTKERRCPACGVPAKYENTGPAGQLNRPLRRRAIAFETSERRVAITMPVSGRFRL